MNKKVSALSDQQLLSAYLSGDKDAISILIERHSKRVLDYIRMMVKNNEVADDIYQETFIKVVRFIDDGRYTDNGKFLSWVYRMVSEQIENDLRKLVDNLPEEQKEVVMMRYFGDLSFKEIAEQTNVSINTALGRMRYALINLRKMIKENQLILT